MQSCFVCRRRWSRPASVSVSVHTSPWHMVRHRNFIFGVHIHMSPMYAHQIFNDSDLLAHLVFYQMSLCNHDLSIVHTCWCCRHHWHLYTALLATGFKIETSYLVGICIYALNIYAH